MAREVAGGRGFEVIAVQVTETGFDAAPVAVA